MGLQSNYTWARGTKEISSEASELFIVGSWDINQFWARGTSLILLQSTFGYSSSSGTSKLSYVGSWDRKNQQWDFIAISCGLVGRKSVFSTRDISVSATTVQVVGLQSNYTWVRGTKEISSETSELFIVGSWDINQF